MCEVNVQERCNDAKLFLVRLQESSSFRKTVCNMSSETGLKGALNSNGYDFDEFQLIKAVAELLEKESEVSHQRSYSTIDRFILDLL